MDATSCLSWLEAAQQFPPGNSDNVTAEKCWNFIDQSAAEILQSPKFLDINHSLLVEILQRNSLRVEEYAVYEAALKWAVRTCERCCSSYTLRPKRAALGEALYQIRFTLMSAKEFGEGSAQSGLLVPEEVASILLYIVTDKKPPIKFVTEPRMAVPNTFQVERFPVTYGERAYAYKGDVLDSISFVVDHDITLVGCGLYTCGKEEHDVDIEIFTRTNKVLRHQEAITLLPPSIQFLTGPACIRSFKFDNEVLVPRLVPCTIQCRITGKETDYGITGKRNSDVSVILDNGKSLLYRFTFVPSPFPEPTSVRSWTSKGQIPTILFRP